MSPKTAKNFSKNNKSKLKYSKTDLKRAIESKLHARGILDAQSASNEDLYLATVSTLKEFKTGIQ